jgi:hypothetical protein
VKNGCTFVFKGQKRNRLSPVKQSDTEKFRENWRLRTADCGLCAGVSIWVVKARQFWEKLHEQARAAPSFGETTDTGPARFESNLGSLFGLIHMETAAISELIMLDGSALETSQAHVGLGSFGNFNVLGRPVISQSATRSDVDDSAGGAALPEFTRWDRPRQNH